MHGTVRTLLRLEGLGVLALAVLLFQQAGYSWLLFALLFLTPDLSLLGYLAGPRVGAVLYNTAHSYVAPLALAALLVAAAAPMSVPLIWVAHIGFDRMLGYGLKYAEGFGHTHLGRIGRSSGP